MRPIVPLSGSEIFAHHLAEAGDGISARSIHCDFLIDSFPASDPPTLDKRRWLSAHGMSKELGKVAYQPETGSFLVGQTPVWRPRTCSDETAEAIDHMVKDLIERAFHKARSILERNRSELDTSARKLLAREAFGPDELAKLTAGLEREVPRKPGLVLVE